MRLVGEDISCIRGGRTVFRNVSFAVAAGESLLLTGPNGSGKTSLLRLIAGLVETASGSIRLEGAEDGLTIGQHAHFVGHLDAVKGALTAGENLAFWCRFLGGDPDGNHRDLFGLRNLADIPAGLLSAGQKRRLALSRVLTVPRILWLLDEPSVSLDAQSVGMLAAMIGDHVAGGGMVVAATHSDLGLPFTHILAMDRPRPEA